MNVTDKFKTGAGEGLIFNLTPENIKELKPKSIQAGRYLCYLDGGDVNNGITLMYGMKDDIDKFFQPVAIRKEKQFFEIDIADGFVLPQLDDEQHEATLIISPMRG